jgi:hypothetical protein
MVIPFIVEGFQARSPVIQIPFMEISGRKTLAAMFFKHLIDSRMVLGRASGAECQGQFAQPKLK